MSRIVANANSITLNGAITRADVADLRQELLEVLASPAKPRELRLANVDSIDSAGIQLLYALCKGFPQVKVTDVSDPVRAVLVRLGVPGLFGGV